MEKEIRKITISSLEVGMYIQDVFNKKGVLLLAANSLITSIIQIEKLKNQGVESLYINIKKGKDVSPEQEAKVKEDIREVEYFQEVEKAKHVYRTTLDTARETLKIISKGKDFSVKKVEKVAEDIIDSILRNSDALVSLCQIKGYDEYTYTHSVNVGVLVASLARSIGYESDRLLHAGVGGLLHDIGKMKIPENILNKPGKYLDWEFNIMKRHPRLGFELVKDKKEVSEISKAAILQHHERYNGQGYPDGLKGSDIMEIGIMCAVADVYDAMTSDRVYRTAWTPQKALALIFQGCDKEYSRNIVEHFTSHLGIYPVGSFVKLVSGEMGIVVRVERGNLLAPVVLILFNKLGARLERPVEYGLYEKQKQGDGKQYKIEISLNPKAFRVDVNQYMQKRLSH